MMYDDHDSHSFKERFDVSNITPVSFANQRVNHTHTPMTITTSKNRDVSFL